MSKRIVFIDSHIHNYQSLIAQLSEGVQAVLLDAGRDGIGQILAALQGKTNLAAIDIISHGSSGTITLGSGILNNANIDDYQEPLGQIGRHLAADGDILLYGCEVAKGEAGQAFVERLSQLTYANVAASTNLTGAAGLGGDWLLEAHWGAIQTQAMQFAYDGVLAIIDGTIDDNTLTGTAEDDTFTGGAGNDTLIGNGGNDIAVFLGTKAGYEVSVDATGQILVKDINPADGDDGTDTLTDFTTLRFADGSFHADVIAGGEFQVNTYTTDFQGTPSITGLSDGGFVVSWTSLGQDGSLAGVYAQRYDANGMALGSEFRVNTTTFDIQSNPSITALSGGGFVVSWISFGQDGSDSGIYAQRYDASGNAAGGEFQVNTTTPDVQFIPSIAALSGGGFVVAGNQGGRMAAATAFMRNVLMPAGMQRAANSGSTQLRLAIKHFPALQRYPMVALW